ncbi:MAG: KGK domain-containing protein [Nostoc sp. DedVER02]|uniref:KGK domain-containing protein n=1 Tax=unclassified Nostoc TaxID=2593658 RepID=UPI002AD53987|nr:MULTISPECIES: KGK domain-containing protein [unclassified Nostoc]MDZ7985750.1 KGK domain-containing protein [Nostoc sp. DedVER02]MDZ8111407.1 KGK domain-containing protein [Nostoc sp. DedVER01b]
MNNKFITLDCDDDVVLLQTDTFKVSRLKELVRQQICSKWENHIASDFLTQKAITSISAFFQQLAFNQETIKIDEIKFNLVTDCQILKIKGTGWQKGKLEIQIYISNTTKDKYKFCLKFCPYEQDEPESPLDDIRKMIQAETT